MGLILSLIVAACAQGQSSSTNPVASASPASASVAEIRDAELSLRQEIRTRAGLVNIGPGAVELAALMDQRESVALNALKADVSATSKAPYAMLVDAPTPGQSITGPVTILTGAFGDTMIEGVTNTRTLDDNALPSGECVAGMGTCSRDPDPDPRSGTKTVTEDGVEDVIVAGNPGKISTQTTMKVGFADSSISMAIEIKTKGEIFDAASKALVYRIESTGSGLMTGDACPDASGISKLHLEFSAYENYFVAVDGGRAGYGLEQTYAGDVGIKADDNANLAGIDIAVKTHVQAKGGSRAAGASQSDLRTFSNDAQGIQTFGYDAASGFTAGTDSVQPTSKDGLFFIINGMSTYLTLPAKTAARATEKAWQSGMCIRVSASPNGGEVGKDSVTSVTVSVKQRYEGTELDKPVEATFSGVKSLDPAGQKQPAPATYSFTAGSTKGDKGQLAFKSVSNRGIGHTSLQFVVRDDQKVAKGFAGTVTLVEDWRDGASWSKQTLTINVRVVPRAGYDGVTGWFDDDGSTYEYESSSFNHTENSSDPSCFIDTQFTSSGAGSFGSDSLISFSVDTQPPGEASLGVDIKAPTTGTLTQTCLGQTQTTTGTSDGGWNPYCGSLSDLTGAPATAGGSHDFSCSAPKPNGTGGLIVSGSLSPRQ